MMQYVGGGEGWPRSYGRQRLYFCSLYLGLDLSLHVNPIMSVLFLDADKRKLNLLSFRCKIFLFIRNGDSRSFASGGRFGILSLYCVVLACVFYNQLL